jgi:hypothetical protein
MMSPPRAVVRCQFYVKLLLVSTRTIVGDK